MNLLKKISHYASGLVKLFRNIKIQSRLLLLFFVIYLIPLFIISIFYYGSSIHAINVKISTYSVQVMSQISEYINREVERLEYDSVDIGFSDLVQKTLLSYDRMSQWEIMDAQLSMRESLVKKFSFMHDISDVLLFTSEKDKIIAYGDYGFKFDLKEEFLDSYLGALYEKGGKPVWVPVNIEDEEHLVNYATEDSIHKVVNGVLIGRAIKSLNDGDIIGSLIIRINERYFSNIYDRIDIGGGSDVFIINSKGVVVSSGNKDIIVAEPYKDKELIKYINQYQSDDKHVFDFEMDNHRYLVAFAPIENTDWFTVSTIPYSYLNSEYEAANVNILFFGLICFMLAVILLSVFSKSILIPLKRLTTSMNEVKKGNLSLSIGDDGRDEIGEVTQNFNLMLVEIRSLMENIKFEEKQKRKAELKALQAQINPHFLSNTLNTVKWLANIQNAENIENIITSLINLLHICIGKEDGLISIREELEYIKDYINIQEYRYYDKFKISFEIEEEILDYKIPKFTLQPIVENSLIHGIGPMEGQGVIIIRGLIYEDRVKISVTDNGLGIAKDKLSSFSCEGIKNKSGFNGIGINNVNERIKMYFGEQYGLNIQSVQGLFTTVEITIPIV